MRQPHAQFVWQQCCNALAYGEHLRANQLLEEGVKNAPDDQSAAEVLLLTASVSSMYGVDGAFRMKSALNEAVRRWPACAQDELTTVLHDEANALIAERAPSFSGRPEGLLAQQHLHNALFHASQFEAVLQMAVDHSKLPYHLQWRYLLHRALAIEELHFDGSRDREMIALYDEALAMIPEVDAVDRLSVNIRVLGMANLDAEENGNPEKLARRLGLLERAMLAVNGYRKMLPEPDPLMESLLSEAEALANDVRINLEMLHGNPERALEHLNEAWERVLSEGGEPSMEQVLMKSEIYNHLGRQKEVGQIFKEALAKDFQPEEKLYLRHHLAIWHIEQEHVIEAEELLQSLRGSDYPWPGEVLADLGKCRFQVGDFKAAEEFCTAALQHPSEGAQCAAHLLLGQIQMEYCDHLGAEQLFRKVIDLAEKGSDDWAEAHQLLSENMAREGFPNPMAAHQAATIALEHTHPDAEWYDVLLRHQRSAAALMGQDGGERILN